VSKIGKKSILIPPNVKIMLEQDKISASSEKGTLLIPKLLGVEAFLQDSELKIKLTKNTKQAKSNWGTLRALIANAVLGLTKEFEKTLVLEGVGYRIIKDGKDLILNLGFSHPVKYPARPGINFAVEGNNVLKISGIDKITVGQVAAEIRALKKPEPYKGKGFRYKGEIIRRKVGKKAAATSA
jgi:large subunit ribosomal protein L6